MRNEGKIDFIQALRGIAALVVVLFHGSRFISPYGQGLGDTLFGWGGVAGVTLFFILSGFIMVYTTTQSGVVAAKDFAIKRVSRVWPVYVVATVFYIFFARGWQTFFAVPENGPDFLRSMLFIPASTWNPSLGVGWTLNYEMYFYLFFGASLLFGRARWAFFSFWVISTLIIAPVWHGTWSLSAEAPSGFKHSYVHLMTSPIIWTFVAGSIIGLIYRHPRSALPERFAMPLLLWSIVLVIWQFMTRYRFGHGIGEFGVTLAPMVLIMALYSKTHSINVPKSLVWLGNISFSIYLWHPLAQETIGGVLNTIGASQLAGGFSCLLLTTAITITLGAVSHHYLEMRLSGFIRAWMSRRFGMFNDRLGRLSPRQSR